MRARGTLILLALCLAVGGYLWFVERGKPTGEAKDAADRQVLAIPPDSAQGFRLDYGDSMVVLAQSRAGWLCTIVESVAPSKRASSFLADEAAIESLTGFFTRLTADRLLPKSDIESGGTGLDQPWVRVRIMVASDSSAAADSTSAPLKSHELAFGFQNPTRTAYYTQIDQRPDLALLSSSAIDAAFRRPLSDFRDKHLARFDTEQAATIDLASPERTLTLRRIDDRWWIDRPHVLADEAQVRGLLTRLRDLQAVELGRDPARDGFLQPALEVMVRGAQDSALAELTIGPELQSGGETLHLARGNAQPVLTSIRAEDVAGLNLTVLDLRDRHLVDLAGAPIDSLTITAGGRRVQAVASDSAFATVFSDLPEWQAMSFASESAQGPAALASYGLAPPRLTLRAKLRNGGTREVFLGSNEPSGGVFAARAETPGVLVVPEAVVETIEQALAKAERASGKKAPPPPGSP